MKRRALLWVGAAFLALVIVVPLLRSNPTQRAGPASLTGSLAPEIALRDDRGARVAISDFRGKIVVLNLWASWCPPCRAEMPDLSRLAVAYAKFGVVVVGVDQGESAQRAAAFAQSLRIGYPIWLDDQQRYGRIFTALGLPTTVFIGRDGVIAAGFDGALTYGQMQDALEPILAHS